MESGSIWPERVITLRSASFRGMKAERLLSAEHRAQVIAALPTRWRNVTEPCMLTDSSQLLALLRVGKDAVAGSDTLLVRITNDIPYEMPVLRLTIVPYPHRAPSQDQLPSLAPHTASELLDQLAVAIAGAIPDLIETDEDRDW